MCVEKCLVCKKHRIRYGPCWYDTYSIQYTCTWRFQNEEFWISTTKWMFGVDLYSESNKYTKLAIQKVKKCPILYGNNLGLEGIGETCIIII